MERLRSLRLLLGPVLLCAVLLVGCADRGTELEFVDDVRHTYPELSVSRVSTDELVSLGRHACRATGLGTADRRQLEDLGIAEDALRQLAQPLCPSR